MNKVIFFIITISIGLFYILHFDKYLTNQFVVINDLKKVYVKHSATLNNSIEKFFQQAQQIEILTKQNKKLSQYQNLYTSSQSELANIREGISTLNTNLEEINLVKVLSYVNFDDFTKVWLDTSKNKDKIQGLMTENYSAGIVIQKAGRAQALLNGNEKCNYAVFIGKDKAPGIIHKNANKNLLTIKFIPIWIDINVGDEVITSGMDNIFFEGLNVGKVVKINKMADQQEAFIRPYAKVLQKKYFYLYDRKMTVGKKEIKKESIQKAKKKTNKKP